MPSGTDRRAASAAAAGIVRLRFLRSRLGAVAGLALGLVGAGCTADGESPGMAAVSAGARGPSVAFESIDGPPVGIFQKLVVDLSEEAQARQIMVVSRESPASYRIRGFLAVHVDRGRPQVAWVWDVYDAEKRRALRISGEEPGTRRGSDAWNAADDQMLRRIARASVERLVAFLASPPAPPGEPSTPIGQAPRVAAADDAPPTPSAAASFAPR